MGSIFGKLFKSVEEDVVLVDVVPEAKGKRKAREDVVKKTLDKHRRLDNEMPSSSGDAAVESRKKPEAASAKRTTKRKAVADDGPAQTKKKTLDPLATFQAKYEQLKKLGQGGYGSVYAGIRKEDDLDVAIKHIPFNEDLLRYEDDDGQRIPMEVAVMQRLAAQPERHPAPINLIDWYDVDGEAILVLERPAAAVDLRKYLKKKGGVREEEVKIITRQLVDAAIYLQQKQIFHRDFKMENLLIEPDTEEQRVRVIDFGAACFAEEGATFKDFLGTHVPPDWYSGMSYRAEPTTVFQVGALLLDTLDRSRGYLSDDCEDFSRACLEDDPEQRPTLKQLRNHPWLR